MTSLDARSSSSAPAPAVSATAQRGRVAAPAPSAVPAAVSATHGEHVLRRGVAAVGLLGIALVHVLDLPGKLEEVPYLGVAYLGLIAASLLVAEALVRRDDRRAWALSAGLSASVILGFVVDRTVGMPGAMDDIGNWLEPLGVASLFVEGVVLVASLVALVRRPTRR
jgi:hypothetical protein